MNKVTLFLAILVTALITFIFTAVAMQTNIQGHDAAYWNEQYQSTETTRQADFTAITCVRGLGYTNFPDLETYYTVQDTGALDQAGNYYSKGQIDGCLYGL